MNLIYKIIFRIYSFTIIILFLIIFVTTFKPDYVKASSVTIISPQSTETFSASLTVTAQADFNALSAKIEICDATHCWLPDPLCNFISPGPGYSQFSCTFDTSDIVIYPTGLYHIFASATDSSGIGTYTQMSLMKSSDITLPVIDPSPPIADDSNPRQTIPKPTIIPSPTPEPTPEPTPIPESTITLKPIIGRPDLSPIPVAISTVPVVAKDIFPGSTIINEIQYDIFKDKPIHLEKIENRKSVNSQKFLYLIGKSFPNTTVKITIKSQPKVMTSVADANGAWTYTLTEPLAPGSHEVFLEVNNGGEIQTSGPYPFSIAQAQSTPDNPTGASLNLVNPQKEAIKLYLYLSISFILAAIGVLVIFLYIKNKKKKTPQASMKLETDEI